MINLVSIIFNLNNLNIQICYFLNFNKLIFIIYYLYSILKFLIDNKLFKMFCRSYAFSLRVTFFCWHALATAIRYT
jgi:hypothetical protein